MALPDMFDQNVCDEIVSRIRKLNNSTTPLWGKMSVNQMLAHCCVTYEMLFEDKHPKPKGFIKWMLKNFVKGKVVSEKPYRKGNPTGPQFLIQDERNFEVEQKRLIEYIYRTMTMGGDAFQGKESHSFGPLTREQWNNMFYKHLDHHLQQFGV